MTIRIILAIVIIAAAIEIGVNVNSYIDKSLAKEAIQAQIDNGRSNLALLDEKTAKLLNESAEYSTSVEAARAEIAMAQAEAPAEPIDTNLIVRSILDLGQSRQVNVTLLKTQEWAASDDPSLAGQSTTLNLEAAGPKNDLIDFIHQLPELYNTLVIDKLSVAAVRGKVDSSPEGAADQSDPPVEIYRAYLTLVVYAR